MTNIRLETRQTTEHKYGAKTVSEANEILKSHSVNFDTRRQAQAFCTEWTMNTLTGHTMTAGMENVTVTVWDVTPEQLEWIKRYKSVLSELDSILAELE